MAYSSELFKNSLGYLGESLYSTQLAKLQLAKLLADARTKMGRDAWWDAFKRRSRQQHEEIAKQWEWLDRYLKVPSWASVLAGGLVGGAVQGVANYFSGKALRDMYEQQGQAYAAMVSNLSQPSLNAPGPRSLYGTQFPSPSAYPLLGAPHPPYGWGYGYAPLAPVPR